MSSLYNISEDILRIFNDVENAEGEITDEQYNALCIKKDELKDKLDSYVKAIKSWEVDEKALRDEKKKFNDRQNVLKNRIIRLKDAALKAVLTFGEHSKSNAFIELPKYRLFSRSSKSIEVDEKRIDILLSEFSRYINELVSQDILCGGENVDLQGILDCINANVKAEMGDDFEPFTISDLLTLRVNISTTASIYELFKRNIYALKQYGYNPINSHITNNTTKDDWKIAIDIAESQGLSKPTLANIVINQSLQIK